MKLLYFVLAIAIMPMQAAIIQVVPKGTTETDPITLEDERDGLIVEEGGAIATTDVLAAVTMEADQQFAENNGRITNTSATTQARGIFNNGGDFARITNNGFIQATGIGQLARGIFIQNAPNSLITNNGTVVTISDAPSFGITTQNSDNVRITNSGVICAINQGNSTGVGIITFTGDNTVITNSGLVKGISNGDGRGINVQSPNVQVINSGTIIGQGEVSSLAAIFFGINPTLTLLRGSNLQGAVFTVNDLLNLNVETGLNLALTLGGIGYGELGIEAPFVQVGNVVGVIDPTGLAMQADVLADLSDTILNGIYPRRNPCSPVCGCGFWAQGIGSYRDRGHQHDIVGYENWQGGFLVGYDTYLCGGNAGIFGGATFGEVEVDRHTQKADTRSYVGGLTYSYEFCNTFVGAAIALGYVDWDNDRFVMNNLADGGVERAHADLDGFFLSPEIKVGHRFCTYWGDPNLNFTLRYARLSFGDYEERGSLTNLKVKDRALDLLTTRFEAAFPCTNKRGNCCWSVEPFLGVYGRYQVGGNDINGELLEEPLHFNQEGPRNLAAFLFGFRGVQSLPCFDLFLNLEASFDTDSSSRILGEGGISWSF